MNIYFAASISGGRQRQPVMANIVEQLQNLGYVVLNKHIAQPDVLEYEAEYTPQQIFRRDLAWIRACQAMVAEVSTPSLGVGYEISYALQQGKPVLCLCEANVFLTAMLTGNDSPGLKIVRYQSHADIRALLQQYLTQVD